MKQKIKTGLLLMGIYKTIIIGFIISIILHCCSQKNNVKTNNNNELKTIDMINYVELEKNRIEKLMNTFSKPLKKVKPIISADQASALYATAYQVIDEDVFCVIYLYKNQEEHKVAHKLFTDISNADIKKTIFSSNGGLFFIGFQKTDDLKSGYTLNALAAKFAGEE